MAPRDLGLYPEVQTRPDVALDERPDLAKPSLEGLAWLLRHPEEWKTHHWDFSRALTHEECGTAGCAMGLAKLRWGERNGSYISGGVATECVAHYWTISENAAAAIFVLGWCDESEAVTPSVVAGRIDDYLAGRPIRYLKEGDRSAAHAVPE